MAVRTSAGILLFRRHRGRLEVLLAHPGGPWFAHKDLGAWTIPKGLVTEAEQTDGDGGLLAAALREFREETGHHPPDTSPPIELGSITQKSGKVVWAWAIEGDLDPLMAFSNTFEAHWPPWAPRVMEVPEIDRVAWYAPTEARRRIIPAQAELIDRLEAALAATAAGVDEAGASGDQFDGPTGRAG
jgi:predicted NUDIX family NTP pyrophosphohydrolase